MLQSNVWNRHETVFRIVLTQDLFLELLKRAIRIFRRIINTEFISKCTWSNTLILQLLSQLVTVT